MKRIIRRMTLYIVMSCLVLLAGCNKEEAQQARPITMGRYVEKAITLPEVEDGFIMKSYLSKEGNLQLLVFDGGMKCYELVGGESWELVEGPWTKAFDSIGAVAFQSVTMQDENMYIAYWDEEMTTQIIKITEEGLIEKIKVKWKKGDEALHIKQMEVLGNEDLLLTTGLKGVLHYSQGESRWVGEYGEDVTSFVVVGDTLVLGDLTLNSVQAYDLKTQKQIEVIKGKNIDEDSKLVKGLQGNDYYLINGEGLWHRTQNGGIWEGIMEDVGTSLNMNSLKCKEVVMKDAMAYYIIFINGEGLEELKYYSYDKNLPARATEELVVYTLEDNLGLRDGLAYYEIAHPEVKVHLQVGMEEGSSLTKADAIRFLNVELLAGKGPDLIVLDSLPVATYKEKGVLEDLTSFLTPYFQEEKLLENIVGAKKDEKIYTVPTHFTLPILFGDEKVTQNVRELEDLVQYIKRHEDQSIVSKRKPEELITQWYTICAPDLFNEEGEVREENMVKFLEGIRIISKNGETNETDWYLDQNMLMEDDEDVLDVAHGEIGVAFMRPEHMSNLLYVGAVHEVRGGGDLVSLESQEGKVFEPKQIVGINAKSEKKTLALDLLETLLSEPVQNLEGMGGFPIHQGALENWLEGKFIKETMMYSVSDEQGRSVDYEWGYEKEIQKFKDYIKAAQIPSTMNETLLKIIVDESRGYFKEETSVEEVTKRITQKVKIYQTE